MAYDVELADRVRALLGVVADVEERKMFGGLAFLVQGNMAVVVSGAGGLMVRVGPEASSTLIATTPATAAVMKGRAMKAWVVVGDDDVATADELEPWVERGVSFAQSLPAKR